MALPWRGGKAGRNYTDENLNDFCRVVLTNAHFHLLGCSHRLGWGGKNSSVFTIRVHCESYAVVLYI